MADRHDMVAMAELSSSARVAPAHTRADPYHQRLWSSGVGGATVAWGGRAEMEAWGAVFSLSRRRCAEAFYGAERARRLTALAALQMWRLMTTEQLAAIVGDARWLSARWPRALVLGLGAGYLQVGRLALAAPHSRRRHDITLAQGHLPALVRPIPGALASIGKHLSYAEWLSVTGGRPWATPVPYNRHGVLATEASLRVAEHLDIGAVLGETVADLSSVLGVETWRRADAVWARRDGLIIVVEVVAAASTGLPAKAAWWADTLARSAAEPVVLLFLVASPPTQWGRSWQHDVPQCVARAAFGSFEAVSARVSQRMAVAFWEDWWPQPGFASRSYMSLRASRPTGPGPQDLWEPVDLLAPSSLPGPSRPGPLLANAALLGGVPAWLRQKQEAPGLREALWAQAGFPSALAA